MKKIKILLLIITSVVLQSCAHVEKKAPCDFDETKSKQHSSKEDLTQ